MSHCNQCSYCEGEPGAFERLVPGFTSLSSGYGESKGDTALCTLHNMFMLPGPACGDFASAAATHSTTTQ